MSSLTSLGVNKNKKLFAPKLSKRKDRNDRKPNATKGTVDVSPKTDPPQPAIAGKSSRIQGIDTAIPSVAKAARSMAARTVDSSLTAVKLQPMSATVDSTEKGSASVDTKNEPLTEEELAINASAASRKRRRPSYEEPVPTNTPSPMSAIDKPDCTFEKHRQDVLPFLKVERMTPDTKKRLYDITEEPQQPTDDTATSEDLVPIRKESVAPKIDLDDDNIDYSDLLASGEDDDVDVDGDVHVERLMPVYIDVGTPSSKEPKKRLALKRLLPRSSKSSANVKLKAARYSSDQDESDQLDEDKDKEEEKEEDEVGDKEKKEQPKPAPKKRMIQPLKVKRKSIAKEKPVAKKKSTPSSKGAKKGGATAVSIGINIPTASSSTRLASSGAAKSDKTDPGEEEYSEVDSDGKRVVRTRKKKQKGEKKYKYAYRLVENMKTLDDITNDPTSVNNLHKPMSSFTKDVDGIVSKTFKEMETQRMRAKKKKEETSRMSQEELEALRKKEAEEERIATEIKEAAKAREEERRKKELEGKVLAESSNALQVRIVNGEIVLDADSLVVERREGSDANYGENPMEIVEENSTTKKVNSGTYGKRKQSSRWDDMETALFYDCLSQFGTDFEMIANMIPGRNRSQIRTKFNREEKLCPEKVTEYMITKRKLMDLDKYKEVTGIELETVPDDFHEMQLA
ncbi:hypothetical protein BD408DRAFT_424709 [Parasitella parasitica]|nr:hypothetical protein BD408DRAFT_424709 [Parasitella parasitica]